MEGYARSMRDRLLDGRLKLRHLLLVVTIADEGGVMAAARALYITQPAVTRALHEVEAILEVSLFDRGPHGVTPTVYGTSFVAHARSVLAQLRQADERIGELVRADAGQVVVGTHLAGSNLLLPRAIATVKAEHPHLTVVVREAAPTTLYRALAAGEVDLVIGRLVARPPEELAQERLYREPVRLVARTQHPVHELRRPSLAALVEFPWILPIEETALRKELEEAFVAESVALPANRVECTSMLTLRQLLLTTDAIAVLPELIARDDDGLRVVEAKVEAMARIRQSVGVVSARDRTPSPGAAALLEELRRAARELGLP